MVDDFGIIFNSTKIGVYHHNDSIQLSIWKVFKLAGNWTLFGIIIIYLHLNSSNEMNREIW